jgi:hypothetical protein
MDRCRGGGARAFRLSIAGLMILVGAIAVDCALVVHSAFLWDRSPGWAVCLLIDVMPVVTGLGIVIPLVLQRPARR